MPSQAHRASFSQRHHTLHLVTLLYSFLLNLTPPPPPVTTTTTLMLLNTASFVAGAVVASPEQPAKLVRDQRRVPGSWRARRGAASNVFRTYCMKELRGDVFIPASPEVEFIMSKGWVPCLEFDKEGKIHRSNSSMPGYYDGRYWTLWKLPMFGCSEAAAVLREVDECRREYADAFIRLIAFDSSHQCQCMSFVVHKPPSAAAAVASSSPSPVMAAGDE